MEAWLEEDSHNINIILTDVENKKIFEVRRKNIWSFIRGSLEPNIFKLK